MKGFNLLFVDDEPDMLEMLSLVLKQEGNYTIYTASNGEEALKMMGELEIDLILSDNKMPKMNSRPADDPVQAMRISTKTATREIVYFLFIDSSSPPSRPKGQPWLSDGATCRTKIIPESNDFPLKPHRSPLRRSSRKSPAS